MPACKKHFGVVGGIAAILAGAAALVVLPAARGVEITLPQETVFYDKSPLPGFPVTQVLCISCHSADYVRYQPSMPRAFWKAAVLKMKTTFGAPIPDSEIEPIVDYLVKTYGAERTAPPPATAGATKPAASRR